LHVALTDRAGVLEQAVGKRGFAMVDVGDDAEVPHERLLRSHGHVRENTHVAVVLAIGAVLFVAGFVLLLNVFGAGDYVIGRVTSRYLGELPPGFAATKRGFRTYSTLVLAVGIVCLGVGLTSWLLPVAAGLLVIGAVTFGIASMLAIAGEVEVYRAYKH
jgi:hypothetical protein